ncbi:MAG TPA: FAD-binding oxidoreductase [Bdellovibrionota bacterium]|nr:FAD-binding oxidoreductase [Bdellovibrionota bacterium]
MMTPTVFELKFEPSVPFDFKSGQFISIVIPGAGPNGRDLRRAYSIASTSHVRPIELCIKYVPEGPGTSYLYKLREGDTFKGFAPYGDFVYKTPPEKGVWFISTGTGIAPFRAMAESHDYQARPPREANCLFGVREQEEILYQDAVAKIPNLKWIPCISKPGADWRGFKGRVTDYLRGLPADYAWLDHDYYLCGNGEMINEVVAFLTDKGVQKPAIHREKYY